MTQNKSEIIQLGIIGAGGFTRFSVKAFLDLTGVELSGVYDIEESQAISFSKQFQCSVFNSLESLLSDDSIDIVYIATPPFLHYAQSKAALNAGKHVFCEKPAALHSAEVEELLEISKEKNLLYVVNLMQRYNPLFDVVKNLVEEEVLGSFLHGYFENYASDENLNEEHWMWDETKSGGIFIEHAVHFFDLFTGWLGDGEVIAAQKRRRQGTSKEIYPEVQSVCTFRNGLVNLYHGFHQADKMDRQELKLVFENGDITLFEWVPSRITIHALVSKEILGRLMELLPGAQLTIKQAFEAGEKKYRNHSKSQDADFKVMLEFGDDALKLNIYKDILCSILSDQIAWIYDRTHKRKIDGLNGLNSLKMAEKSNEIAVII